MEITLSNFPAPVDVEKKWTREWPIKKSMLYDGHFNTSITWNGGYSLENLGQQKKWDVTTHWHYNGGGDPVRIPDLCFPVDRLEMLAILIEAEEDAQYVLVDLMSEEDAQYVLRHYYSSRSPYTGALRA